MSALELNELYHVLKVRCAEVGGCMQVFWGEICKEKIFYKKHDHFSNFFYLQLSEY